MSAPTNISALTARDLGLLPASITEDVTLAPTGDGLNEVWFQYTARVGEVQIALTAFAAAGFAYQPEIVVWLGPAAAPTPYLNAGDGFQIDATQAGIIVPVTAGTTYYFQVFNAGTAPPGTDLVLSAETAPALNVSAGAVLVPDDSDGFNALLLNPTTGEPLTHLPIAANGDWGVITTAGVMAFDHPAPDYFSLYDASFTRLRTGYGTAQVVAQIATDLNQTFYIAHGASYAVAKTITAITAAGVVGASWTLPADSIAGVRAFAMAPSRDNTILYYAKAKAPGEAIHRFDLVNGVALSDLAAGVTGALIQQDILVLADGTLIVGYIHQSGPNDNYIRHYAADGTILHTYDYLTDPRLNRLAMAVNDPVSFWSWFYPDGDAGFGTTGRFSEIAVADGSVLSTFDRDLFTNGVNQVPYADAPRAPFGPSFSCPFLIVRAGGTPSLSGSAYVGPFLVSTGTIIVEKVSDGSDDVTTPFTLTATGGLTPDTFTLVNGASRTFVNVPIGNGYGFEETLPAGWSQVSAVVSNGSPIDNITVAEGETVTVTFTNHTCECCVSTQITCINEALLKLGISNTIVTLNDASREAHTGRLLFPAARKETLRAHPWDFATKYAKASYELDGYLDLVAGSEATPYNRDWTYAYSYPVDCLFARRMVREGIKRTFDRSPIVFREGRTWDLGDGLDVKLILSNEPSETAELEYTADVTCAEDFADALFLDALSWKLATKMAPSLTRIAGLAEKCFLMWQLALSKAATVDVREQQQEKHGEAEWIDGR